MSFSELAERSAGYAKRIMDLEAALREALPLLEEAHSEAREGFRRGHLAVVILRTRRALRMMPPD
jgi:hypothetical protein